MASVEPVAPPTVSVTASVFAPSESGVISGSNTSAAITSTKKSGPLQTMETSARTPDSSCSAPTHATITEVNLKPETPLTPAHGVSPLKRPRHKPSERKELLLMAVNDVIEQNISMRKAASRYNLAKSSLCDFVRKNGIKLPNNRCKPTAASVSGTPNGDPHLLNSRTERREVSSLLGLPSDAMNLLRAQHTATPPTITSFSRLESPWNNVAGLPTQVPMQNWSTLATTKALASVSQPNTISSPTPSNPTIVSMESDSSPVTLGNTNNSNNNNSNNHLSGTSTFNSSSFICNPTIGEVFENVTNAASFYPPVAPPSVTVEHFPVPPLANVDTARATEPTIPTPLSRSLASLYAPPTALNSTSSSSTSSSSQIPLVFPTNPVCASDPTVVDSFQNIILAATRVDGKQLFPANLGDLFDASVNLPPSSTALSTATDIFLRKFQIPNYLNSLMAGQLASQPPTTQYSVVSRLPQLSPMAHTKELIDFINKSPSPFHVVQSAREILTNYGFRELFEDEVWKIGPGDCVFVTKNRASLFAIAVGAAYKSGDGFGIIGAHTDSPCLRLKPVSERSSEGFTKLAVQTYGKGLWHTWFDRDLTLAGRCVVRNSATGGLEERLVHINRPLTCVPSQAAGHGNQETDKHCAPNLDSLLAPVLCTTLTEQLYSSTNFAEGLKFSGTLGHPASLLRLLAAELQCNPSEILDLELYLADTQPASTGGVHEEFLHAPRLDNQLCVYASVQALIKSLPSLKEDHHVRVVCLYDHEEVGSPSIQSTDSTYIASFFRRIVESLASNVDLSRTSNFTDVFERTMVRSFFLSADQAHAAHPSQEEKKVKNMPGFHQGLVLKHLCSQNYSVNGLASAIAKEVARRCQVPLQEYVSRQDRTCGNVFGTLLASHLGVMTAEVGGAQLAMHSCREMTCTSSVGQAVAYFTGFFEHIASIMAGFSFK